VWLGNSKSLVRLAIEISAFGSSIEILLHNMYTLLNTGGCKSRYTVIRVIQSSLLFTIYFILFY
jgi:hypothetical protein